MNLKQQLQADLHAAMRARDARRKSPVRLVLTAVQLAEVEKGSDLNDEEIVTVIRKEVRRREDALELVRQAGRVEMAQEDAAELEVLRAYLPQLMSEEEITTVIRAVIAEVGASAPADLGRVMQVLMPKVKEKADGRVVNRIVRELLSA